MYLGGVQDDCDLSFENNKHHCVLVCAAHTLGGVALNPEIKIIEKTSKSAKQAQHHNIKSVD